MLRTPPLSAWPTAMLAGVMLPFSLYPMLVAALVAAFFVAASAQAASSQQRDGPPAAAPKIVQVRPDVVPIPVIEGTDILFRRMSPAQGLSQTRVSNIVQDDQGFLWFATQHGLNRHDGYDFEVFKHDPAKPGSLSGVYVYSLFKDRSGTIWAGTDQYLDAFDRQTETFRHYQIDAQNPFVTHISESAEGMLWLATNQGLYKLDPKTGRTKRYGHDPGDPASLSSNDIKSSGVDRSGTFWVAGSEGLEAFDPVSERVTLRIPLREAVREFYFHEDRSGTFWIIHGSGNGLATYDRKANLLTRYSFQGRNASDTSLTGVYAILESRDGTIWLGTMGAGLLKYDRAAQRFVSYRSRAGDLDSLAENRVIALAEDTEGNIWTGLHSSLPNSFASAPAPFAKLLPGPDDGYGPGGHLVNAIYQDRDGAVWTGSGGALNRYDRASGAHKAFHASDGGAIEVLALLDDEPGGLWVGSLGRGLQRLDKATGAFQAYRHDPKDPTTISSDIVTRIYIDRAGSMWVTTWNGLSAFDRATGRFKTFRRDPSSSAEPYFSIAQDAGGALWLGGTTGLYRFDPSAGTFASYAHKSGDPRTLSNNSVNSLLHDRSGRLWIGTQNGLNEFDPAVGVIKTYYEKDGLAGSAVSCILEDAGGALWMSTNKGVSRMDPVTRGFSNYSTFDGLPGDDLTGWNACHKGKSGEMFFGGFAGATSIRPEALSESDFVPPVILTELRLAGSVVDPPASTLPRAIGHMQALTLTHKQNDFSLSFAALNFRNPTTMRYRYRLIGLDAGWHEAASDSRTASYTTLPPGRYRFEVQAAASRGSWEATASGVDIVILPPWWNSWWFRAIYIASLLLLAAAAYQYRLRQLAHQYGIRMEERLNERNRIARELHDSLLQSFQSLIFKLQAARDLLPVAPGKAMDIIDAALDRGDQAIIEGRNAIHDLRRPPATGSDLPLALRALGDELDQDKNGREVAIDLRVNGQRRPIPSIVCDEVYRIAREAVWNALQHSHARRILCMLTYEEARLVLCVGDDGKGLDLAVFELGRRDGHWGLPGMRERARAIGATFTVQSESGRGTRLELTIPAAKAYDIKRLT